jgi:hypothetical protein
LWDVCYDDERRLRTLDTRSPKRRQIPNAKN